jgi:phospholipid/cholesterol/gamma-HCH transport system substrate-binding protein
MWNRNVTIGIFVAAGIALFTLGIFLIGNQHKAFAKHLEFYTEFANVDGIMKGAKVQVAGLDAGEVKDIEVPNSPTSRFRLKLRIEERIHGLVRTDSLVTIATEGLVGDKFLLIHPGSAKASEAAPNTTLPSKEPFDLADLLEKSTGLLNEANGTMKAVAGKLNGTLDAMTTTVNNANDLVVGLKEGKGTVGMLLQDERTADKIRQTVANAQQATTSLNHASKQADAMITDFQSRGFGAKADQTMASVQSTARNFDASSQQLHQTLSAALAQDEQGEDAGANIRQSFSNLNQATGNMAEDTEALKHEFFFRGFFKHRGYYSLTNLRPDDYRRDKLFTDPGNSRAWLEGAALFERKQNGSEALSPAGKARIDASVAQFGDAALESPIVVEGYSTAGDQGSRLADSRTRAILVRKYLNTRFQIDLQNIGTVALLGVPPPETHKNSWDGVCIVLLKKVRLDQ